MDIKLALFLVFKEVNQSTLLLDMCTYCVHSWNIPGKCILFLYVWVTLRTFPWYIITLLLFKIQKMKTALKVTNPELCKFVNMICTLQNWAWYLISWLWKKSCKCLEQWNAKSIYLFGTKDALSLISKDILITFLQSFSLNIHID